MRTTSAVPLMVAGALVLPAFALADLGPHSNYYDAHPPANGQKNDVGVSIIRPKHQAFVYVTDYCLGKSSYSGRSYPDTADVPPQSQSAQGIPVKNGQITYHGPAEVFGSTGTATLTATVKLTVGPKRVSGSVTLPGKCGTIRFSARLTASTK